MFSSGPATYPTLINALMTSSSWSDSAFILTFDESGGLYDHVAPLATVSPDGIKPKDLMPGDFCTTATGPTCDFVYTGYRIPLIVVSPFAKKNYVSHTPADLTAILKLIELRFGVASLTARDAAPDGHDGVLRLQQSSLDDAAHAPGPAHRRPLLLERSTLAI